MSFLERIDEIAAKEIQDFREILCAWLLSHLLPQKCSDGKQAQFVLLADGVCANLTVTMWAK